jgi:hypothetical protein
MAGIIKPEFPSEVVLITSRTILSRLWFKLTPQLCDFFHARYQEIYEVEIYAFCLMGNHYHLLARFPKGNRVLFEGDFNSIISRALPRLVRGMINATREALSKLNTQALPSSFESAYNADLSTQVPTGRLIVTNKRVRRKIRFDSAEMSFEQIGRKS